MQTKNLIPNNSEQKTKKKHEEIASIFWCIEHAIDVKKRNKRSQSEKRTWKMDFVIYASMPHNKIPLSALRFLNLRFFTTCFSSLNFISLCYVIAKKQDNKKKSRRQQKNKIKCIYVMGNANNFVYTSTSLSGWFFENNPINFDIEVDFIFFYCCCCCFDRYLDYTI